MFTTTKFARLLLWARLRADFRNILAQSCSQCDLVILFVHEDFANMFGHRKFTQSFALTNSVAIIPDSYSLVLKVELEHVPSLFRSANGLRLGSGHAAEIVNLIRNDPGVGELF